MEKIGLMDLIEKFNEASKGGKQFFNGDEKAKETQNGEVKKSSVDGILKEPDTYPPSQYLMNAKMTAFIEKHDELSKKIQSENVKKKK